MFLANDVERRQLGSSGLSVSVSGLGGNVFGPPRLDLTQTRRIIDAAIDFGVNFVDTANVYGQGHSESFLGQGLTGRRAQMVIATKFNLRGLDEAPSVRDHIRSQAEESLKKLGTDYIDLYQLHHPRGDFDIAEVLEALNELIVEGKVRAIGACNFSSWRLSEANQIAHSRGWASFATVQNYYHLLAREAEAEVIPYAARTGIGILPYHPLAGGFLTGKYRQGQARPEGTRGAAGSGIINTMDRPGNFEQLERLEEVASGFDRTVGELAVAWLAAQPQITSVIAGVSNVEQLRLNVEGSNWQLDGDTLAEIDKITAPYGVRSPEIMPYS